MGLIISTRHTRADLEHWRRCETMDASYVERCKPRLDELEARAVQLIRSFDAAGPCYVGVSWGKDSVVVAHLAARSDLKLPLVWVRRVREDNPDCVLVRDDFLARFGPLDYHEITKDAADYTRGKKSPKAQAKDAAFAEASARFGSRYISGVRAEEARVRALTMARNGEASDGSCRPLGWWTAADVFGYLHRYDLPVHPAYACTFGGVRDRAQIRVGSLGGERGRGHGREEWERRYYPEGRKL